MKKIKLNSGVTLNIEDDVLNNMELLDDLVAMDDGDWRAMSNVMQKVLKDEERKKLYDAIRNEKGVVQIDTVSDALNEIFGKLGETGKNS